MEIQAENVRINAADLVLCSSGETSNSPWSCDTLKGRNNPQAQDKWRDLWSKVLPY